MGTTAADVFAKVKTKEEKVRIVFDPNLIDQHASLCAELAVADEKSKAALAEQIVAVEADIADAEVEFTVRGMGSQKWRKLRADHPPTVEGALYDNEFQFVAIARSLADPVMTVDELKHLNELVTEMQWLELWAAVQLVNIGSASSHPESLAARDILANVGGKSKPRSGSELAAVS